MIELYPSKLDGAPCETYPDGPSGTVESWLLQNVPTYSPEKATRVSARLNGRLVPHDDWATTAVTPSDLLQFYAEPKGAELIIAAVTLAAAAIAVTVLFAPKLPSQRQGGQTQGEGLSNAAIKGNSPRLNSPIPEIAGRPPVVYPDYILPPHKFFADPRTLVVELMLCVGVGSYQIPLSSVRIGDTPAISLGDDASFTFYEPGESLAGQPAAVWWHSAPEVGSTSAGKAGLDLTVTTTAQRFADAQIYNFNLYTVTVPSGAGQFPATWNAGMLVRIEAPKAYTVVDGGGSRDIIEGDLSEIGLFAGMIIEIAGENAGLYEVDDFIPGSPDQLTLNTLGGAPVTGLATGLRSMTIGYSGLRYRITSAGLPAITVERLTDTGATDASWPGWDDFTTVQASLGLDASTSEGDWRGPYMACPVGELTQQLEWDVMFPQGLTQINKYGNAAAYSVAVELQYRDSALAGAWTSQVVTFTNGTLDQIGYTQTATLPYMMRPEVRMRRLGAKSTNPQVADAVQWYALRSRLNAPTSYEGVTTMALTVRIGDRLAAQSESLVSVKPTRILPARLGGVELGDQPTRNPADWVRYIARSVNYSDEDLDLDELDRLGDVWAARGDWFDIVQRDNATVLSAITDALRAGFAEPTIDRGVIRPVRDEPRTVYDDMYSPQNMTGALIRSFTSHQPDDIDGVDVEYFDQTSEQWETVRCRLPADLGIRAEKLRVPGITDRTRAWRIGMRRRRELAYRRKAYSFSTEMDALNSGYLGFVALSDDVPGYSQSAQITAYDAATRTATVTEPFRWGDGTHVAAVRKPDGTLVGPFSVTRIDDYRIQFAESIGFTPVLDLSIELPHVQFGTSERWAYPALLNDISPNGTTGATVDAVNYDVRVYDDDNNAPPPGA